MIFDAIIKTLDKVAEVIANALFIGFLVGMLFVILYAIAEIGEFIYNKMRGRK